MLRLMFVTLVMLLCLHTSLAIAAPAADIAASVQPPLYAIYEARQFAPLWLDNGKPSARASEAITVISQAADDGLDTSDYDLPALRQQLETMLQQPGDDRQQADFDLALSLTLAAFVEDLSVGRVAPLEPGAKTDVASRQVDLPARLQQILTSDNLSAAVAAARPALPPYHALRQLLVQYRALAAQYPQAPALPPLPAKKLEPGTAWDGVHQLADWLVILGDMPAAANTAQPPLMHYDGATAEGVKHFQLRHGLTPDGIIGKQTYQNLLVPLPERVKQIELAMERLRWLDDSIPRRRFILINIPQFTLWAYEPDATGAKVILQMPVVVGKAGKHETPVMNKTLSSLVFNPFWNVPYSIATKELLPKLYENPYYLEHENMELVDTSGRAHGSEVGESELSGIVLGEYRIRQRSGEKNALGQLKFVFPNDDAIYMHDTPSKKLFARERRDFSHGCVRLGNPTALALFALKTQGEWDEQLLQAKISASKDQHLALAEKMPVLLLYFTANVDAEGNALFLPDIYARDAKLTAALTRRRK